MSRVHASAYLSGVLLLTAALITPTVIAGWTSESNKGKKLVDDVPILDTTGLTASDFNVTYTYTDVDDDVQTEELTIDVSSNVTNASWEADTRVIGVDLGLVTTEVEPEYEKTADPFIIIEFPEKANLLTENTVSSLCTGFDLRRGDTAVKPDKLTYKVEIGTGAGATKATLLAYSVAALDDDGNADTNKVGTCKGVSDGTNKAPEFEQSLLGPNDMWTPIMDFECKAFLCGPNPDKPENLWVKVTGVRAPQTVNGTTEEGDIFDFGLQFYGWGDRATTYIEGTSKGHMVFFVLQGIAAIVMLVTVNPFYSNAKGMAKKRGQSTGLIPGGEG